MPERKVMRASPLVMCCWPGLPRLWFAGDRSGLLMALAFGAVLNLLLVSSLARPSLLPSPIGGVMWVLIAGLWLLSTIRECRNWPNLCKPVKIADDRGLFLQAQREYLQRHWF